MASTLDSKKRLALAVIDFLSTSLKDGTLSSDDAESVEVAQSCIADAFHVDASDEAARTEALGGQSLLSIFSVYEKLRAKPSGSSAQGATPSSSASSKAGGPPAAVNPEAEAFKAKGNSAMASKDYQSAIDFYRKALEISPTNTVYLSNRAAAYSASNQHAEASADAEMAVATDPKYTKAWSRLGLARFALGDAKGSMEAYEKGIQYEGNGGSEAMKKGYETAKRRVEEQGKGATDLDDEPTTAPREAGATGGMPDLSSLASMLGGGGRGGGAAGGPDLSSIMNNPMFASMAQNLMSNPDMMNNLMSNPRLRQMAESFGGGGGGGGMPDVSALMQDPSIAEMARNVMGGRGRGGSS